MSTQTNQYINEKTEEELDMEREEDEKEFDECWQYYKELKEYLDNYEMSEHNKNIIKKVKLEDFFKLMYLGTVEKK